ncbi:Protein-methionine-sulfoxide reductase catalytic subunit MsrP [bacterium HR25]|nr:Protein-methionine-sulfoxide reductase catalytic subunit MsrP [bacterium HR25]
MCESCGCQGQGRPLRVIQERPFNAETPLEALAQGAVTGVTSWFVRSHFQVPRVDAAAWRLRVDGAVARPRELSLTELMRLPSRELVVTMECAGNGRTLMSPVPPGVPWGLGAVSTVRFTGVPLATVLAEAGLEPDAAEVLFTGADRGEEAGRREPFARSLPLEVALHPDTLLAWEANGGPLTPEHGFPLRLVVPGWYGMASVKWLERVTALREPFRGYFQSEQYRYLEERGTPEGTPVTRMRVRSLIVRPAEGERLPMRPVEVRGLAWSGYGEIVRVAVSDDEGATWLEAELGRPASPYSATPWRLEWRPPQAGRYVLLSRAFDSAGNAQPLQPVWNRLGYGNNGVQRVTVLVQG